jgi:peptide/nickel transport system permease protein
MPAWINLFRRNKLPETVILDNRDGTASKDTSDFSEGFKEVTLTYVIDYPYTGFPQDVVVDFSATYLEKYPFITLTWVRPDGSETEIAAFSIKSGTRYLVTQDEKLVRRLDSKEPLKALFINPAKSPTDAEAGQYQLRVSAFLFEPEADLDAKLFLYGQVYGLGGTDYYRRDLWLGLLWGAPAALGVGLGGALITSIASMLLAAVGVWYGGWVDSFVQRLAEINLTLPMLPIGIMVYFLLSKNIWVILSVIVVFTVFGAPLKTYRAAFLQVKEMPYIEAAQAYGAGNGRIIRTYLMPRILPVLVPQLVALVPGFIFLEATLAMLGVSDRYLPTWGKIIYDAMINGALRGHYYWVLEPLVLLMLTGIAFALVGLALDRILNPRLRAV